MPSFLGWYCQTPDFLNQVNARGSTNYAAIRAGDVLNYTMPLPPLDEQRRVVSKLDRVAALVEERSQTIARVERESQALLSKAFREVARGAPCHPMSEVAPLVRRPVDVDPDHSYPELGVRSFGRGTFHKPPLVGSDLTWQKLFLIQRGDIVFSNIKAWEGAFAVAGSEDHNHVGSHRYLTCVPFEGIATANFVWFYLQSREGLAKISAASPGSADRNRTLSQKKLEALTVPTPSINKQICFERLFEQTEQTKVLRTSAMIDMDAMLSANLHKVFEEGDNFPALQHNR